MSGDQPLRGRRIVITRPRDQAAVMVDAVRARGGQPVLFPTIKIVPIENNEPLDRALDQLSGYDWVVFTSVNGVVGVGERNADALAQLANWDKPRVAAIGPATAAELERRGVTVQVMPDEFVAERIVDGMGTVTGLRILLPRARLARAALRLELARRGGQVEEVSVYDTEPGELTADDFAALRQGVDMVTFTSSSTVENFFRLLGDEARTVLDRSRSACIGPVTAATLNRLGVRPTLVARSYTTEGLVDAIVSHFDPSRAIGNSASGGFHLEP